MPQNAAQRFAALRICILGDQLAVDRPLVSMRRDLADSRTPNPDVALHSCHSHVRYSDTEDLVLQKMR
jgi:hypothetical protein